MSTTVSTGYNLPLSGYLPQTTTPVAPTVAPTAPTVTGYAPTSYAPTSYSATSLGEGPILPLKAQQIANLAAKVVPTGTAAAVGSARILLKSPTWGAAAEPLFKLTTSVVGNLIKFVGKAVSFQWDEAFKALVDVFKGGAVNTGGIAKQLSTPITATMATAGAPRAGLGRAIAGGLSTGVQALKSSFIWAIPAATINAFIDYKYRDQTDMKRLGTNFAADVLGYTATGMAGAAVGAAVGSMTMPVIGTVVGAAVGIGLGLFHDKLTRPLISDALRDQLG